MPAPADFSSLDALLTKALAKQTPHRPRKKSTDTITPEELSQAERRIKERFTDPANWERVGTKMLVHVGENEQETLLGNFVEYKHKLSSGICRKLVRDESLATVGEVEYVKGSNWLERPLHRGADHPAAHAEEERDAILNITLSEFGPVHAQEVIVNVKLVWGGIARVELFDETRFFSKDKRIQLILPEGMDILEGMSLDSKLDLRKAIGL